MSDTSPWRDYGGSRAVLLGASGYTQLTPVPAARHSLTRMNGLLTGRLCEWPQDRVREIADEPHRGKLPDELMRLFSGVTDVALFYFVGHGQLHDDELCLALTESPDGGSRRPTIGLPFADVRKALYECDAHTKIVILDCCFSGIETQHRNTLAATTDVTEKASVRGAFIMAASGAYQTAWHEPEQDTGNPQTYFTKYLIDTIEQGLPDYPEGLSLRVIFDRTADALARDRLPEPTRSVRHNADHFVLAHNATQLPPTPQQQPTQHRPEVRTPPPVTAAMTTTEANGHQTPRQIVATNQRQLPETGVNSPQSGGNPGSSQVPTPVLPYLVKLTPHQRDSLVTSLIYGIILVAVILISSYGTSSASSLDGAIGGIIGAAIGGTVGLVISLRSALRLTQYGVYVRSWKTTFIRWNEIQEVRVHRWLNFRYVSFVLGDRSTTCWVPADGPWCRDGQFDQKVSTIQQLHAHFRSPEPW
jgi:hypothetical protein